MSQSLGQRLLISNFLSGVYFVFSPSFSIEFNCSVKCAISLSMIKYTEFTKYIILTCDFESFTRVPYRIYL